MKMKSLAVFAMLLFVLTACKFNTQDLSVEVYETTSEGNHLHKLALAEFDQASVLIKLLTEAKFQTIKGFGGAFTESSAYLLNQMSAEKRDEVLEAYFGDDGARYSLCRTHINSCDFSLGNYSYAKVEGDVELKHFSIDEDMDDIIPMIKDAMAISSDGFKILSSPWTAPPWMKDNNSYVGGSLLPEYYDVWANFFSKYLSAYAEEGIDIWGITVENEPLGNGNNWESMYFSPESMVEFTNKHLGPILEKEGHDVKIFGYDQNRGEELEEWADVMYKDSTTSAYFDGMAVHWYASTYDWMSESLNYTHEAAPGKHIIQSEACIDAEVPRWKEDAWYWEKEATDWGWDWALAEQKYLHPKYVPVYRYARDIIGCLNSWVEGWIDWNMVLDTKGGPNWANNWCIAPVIVDPKIDEVYYTPLYYVMTHFSKFIRSGAVRIGFEHDDEHLMLTAVQNPDKSIVIVALNMESSSKNLHFTLENQTFNVQMSAQSIQTIVVNKDI